MENKKIDRIIEIFRNYNSLTEDMGPTMNTGSTPGSPGLSGSSDPTKMAGFDPVMTFLKRRIKKDGTVDQRKVPDLYKKWTSLININK